MAFARKQDSNSNSKKIEAIARDYGLNVETGYHSVTLSVPRELAGPWGEHPKHHSIVRAIRDAIPSEFALEMTRGDYIVGGKSMGYGRDPMLTPEAFAQAILRPKLGRPSPSFYDPRRLDSELYFLAAPHRRPGKVSAKYEDYSRTGSRSDAKALIEAIVESQPNMTAIVLKSSDFLGKL